MRWETDYDPIMTNLEYRAWMVAGFHDTTWQVIFGVLALSTKDYAERVVSKIGQGNFSNYVNCVVIRVKALEQQISNGINLEDAVNSLEKARAAETRLRAVVRYCLDNDVFPHSGMTPNTHPLEAIQTMERDPETQELISARTVYKFG